MGLENAVGLENVEHWGTINVDSLTAYGVDATWETVFTVPVTPKFDFIGNAEYFLMRECCVLNLGLGTFQLQQSGIVFLFWLLPDFLRPKRKENAGWWAGPAVFYSTDRDYLSQVRIAPADYFQAAHPDFPAGHGRGAFGLTGIGSATVELPSAPDNVHVNAAQVLFPVEL